MDKILIGDTIEQMKTLPDECVHCVVTSPPYWGLRDYGVAGQLGLEPTPEEFIAKMVEVFREVRRILRKDGTCWINMGDCFQDKQLMMMPHRLAMALQKDGWWIRSDIVWAKPNPMPESCTDRPTNSHEYIFLCTKSAKYYYNADAIKEPAAYAGQSRGGSTNRYEQNAAGMDNKEYDTRNKRDVWSVNVQAYKEAHFATFPPDLIEPCILAGCPKGGKVLDPFFGSGTTGLVAYKLNRHYLGIELNPEYAAMAEKRIQAEKNKYGLFEKAGVI